MQLPVLALAMFTAAFLQATSGFGFALMAMPLMTLALGLEQAAPVVAAAALGLNLANALRLRRHINWGEWARLGLAGLAGVPLGFWLHAHAPGPLVRALLGLILIGYAGLGLARLHRPPAAGPGWVYAAGLLGGALGGAYNIPGPPVIIYGDLRAWPRDEYRSTLQAFFLVNGLFVVTGHALLGHFDSSVGALVLASVPALALGNLAGRLLDPHLDHRRFRQVVLALVLVTGIALLR